MKHDDSPHGLAILLSRHPGGAGDEKPPMDGDDGMPPGLEDAAQDLIDAIHSGDASAVAHALHDCYSMCGGEPDGDEG